MGLGWRGLKEEGLLSPWFSWVGHWPLNRDLSEAWQGCHGAVSKAAFRLGAEAVPTREQIYLITRLGTLDARPPEQAWGQ